MQKPPDGQSHFPGWKRILLLLAGALAIPVVVLSLVVMFATSAGSPKQEAPDTRTPTSVQIAPTPTQAPTTGTTPVASRAVLGGGVDGFTAKLGKPEQWNEYTTVYQPYVEIATTHHTYAVSIADEMSGKDSVYKVTYRPAKPVKWDDGLKTCKSFLPPDAVQKEENDYGGSRHELIYMSQTIAKQFPPEEFRQGGKPNAPLITPGTIQIYSFYDAPLIGSKMLKMCTIQLGRPN